MAVLTSIATGNWTTAATWSVVDTTSYLGGSTSETSSATVPTSAGASARSAGFTPGAITITGIAVKLANRTGTTGTFTVELWNNTGSAIVAGTTVTINCSDLGAATTAALDGGWIVFDFANVTLAGATSYMVQCTTSSSTQIDLFTDSTTNNWSRLLLTSTTQTPVAGDIMVVAGNVTGAGTGNNITVTMNETATTDYGSAPSAANSLIEPGVQICKRGTLLYGTTAATNYYLKVSSSIIVYRDGTLSIGTTGTPIPRDSTAVLEFDPAADGDYGLTVRNGSTFNIQGLSRTSGKNIVSCKLNTDEAVNSTSLGVDTDTGWLDNDQIAVASTTRTAAQSELGALNGNAGASTLTVDGFAGTGGGLLNAHSGTSPTQAEVINITRNVKVRSSTSTLMAYVNCREEAAVDIDWAEFYYLGENASNKRGIEINTTSVGSFTMHTSSVHDCEDGGLWLGNDANNTSNITVASNVLWSVSSASLDGVTVSFTSGTWTIDSNILIKTGAGTDGYFLQDIGGTFTNNTAVSTASASFNISESGATLGTFSGNTAHSSSNHGLTMATSPCAGGTVSTLTCWRNTGSGINLAVFISGLIFESPILFGNLTNNIAISTSVSVWFKSPVLSGDSTFSTINGISIGTNTDYALNMIIDNGDFSTVSGIKTAHTNDLNLVTRTHCEIMLRNTKLGASTEIATQSNVATLGYIASEKHDQTAGNHKSFLRYGTIQTDSTIFNTAAPSMRMTPSDASSKLESAYQFEGIKVPVASGSTVTINVYTRKSVVGDGAAYTGSEPRLILKANPAIGITADTVIDTHTAAAGTWEQLSGTTAAASGDDGAFEFVVDCDGTAGWVNVDDWSVT